MKSKTFLFSMAFVLMIGLVFNVYNSTAKAKAITLKAITTTKVKSDFNTMFFRWVERVNKQAKGKLVINVIGGPEAIPSFDQFEAVRSGVVDICRLKGTYAKPVVPEEYALILSQIGPHEEREVGYYDLMVKLLKKANVMYLGRINHGTPFFLWTNKEIKNPRTDFKGLSMRSAVVYDPLYKVLGVTPVTMEFTECYTGLERGIIQGYGWPAFITDFGWDKVTKYCINHPFYGMDVQTVVNLDTWKKLPKDLQELMTKTAKDIEPEVVEYGEKYTKLKLKKAFDAGVKPIVFSPGDAKWYLDSAYGAAWEEVKKKCPERYDTVRKMLSK
jgi:TRAP-type C4-dicarboxylate transport system substrate-binding protein